MSAQRTTARLVAVCRSSEFWAGEFLTVDFDDIDFDDIDFDGR